MKMMHAHTHTVENMTMNENYASVHTCIPVITNAVTPLTTGAYSKH